MMEGPKVMKGSRSNHANGGSSIVESPTDSFLKRYKVIEKIGEGSYSEVLKCKHREKEAMVACKRLKHVYRNWSQVNDIAEITTLRTLPQHNNILRMIEIHYDSSLGKVSLVFEIMDLNLYELIKDRKRLLPESRVRNLMFQLMRALRHLHKHGIFHRDIKPENILLRAKTDQLKLGDLGSVRGLYSRPPYTEYISTRWYRSPECLLTAGHYSFKMDIWAAGCVFYEILTLRPLFPGSSELDQIGRIHALMGVPSQRILQRFYKQAELESKSYRNRSQQSRWDGIQKVLDDAFNKNDFNSDSKSKNFEWYFTGKESNAGGLERVLPSGMTHDARELLRTMLSYDPDTRPTAHRVLQHSYFSDSLEKEFGKEKSESKCTVIPIYGDDKGKQMISQHYEPIDLKTLGDKKLVLKRQKEQAQRYLNQQKQKVAEAKEKAGLPPKKSSPILKNAKSPSTPPEVSSQNKKKDVERHPLKVTNSTKISSVETLKREKLERQKKELLMKKSLSEMMLKEKYHQDSMEEESVGSVSREPSPSPPRQTQPAKSLVKVQPKHSIPDTLTAKKRQVLAGNLPPSALNNVEVDLDTNNNVDITVLNEVQNSNLQLSKKVINHKLTPADLQKINQARKLVQMNPIGKVSGVPSTTLKNKTLASTSASTSTGHILLKTKEEQSPYTKPPVELSTAARKKFLSQQQLKLTRSPTAQQKRLERLKMDSSTMHVPPQVAAAALKYTSQSAAAARQAREALAADIPVKKGQSNYSNHTNSSSIRNEYSMGKTRFGHSRLSVPQNGSTTGGSPQGSTTSPQQKLQRIMEELEKTSGISNIQVKAGMRNVKDELLRPVPNTRSKRRLSHVAGNSYVTKPDEGVNNNERSNPTAMELFQTLELDKQKRLSLRRKDEQEERNNSKSGGKDGERKVLNKFSPYTKYLASERSRSKDTISSSNVGNKATSRQNVTEAAGNPLFPRNRFGAQADSPTGRKPNRLGAKFPPMAEVYPTTTTTNRILDDINFNNLADKEDWEQEVNRSSVVKRPQPSKTSLATTTDKYLGQGQGSSQSKGIADAAAKAATRLGLSLPPEQLNESTSYRKPPLPPQKYHNRLGQNSVEMSREEIQQRKAEEAKELRIAHIMERAKKSAPISVDPGGRLPKESGGLSGTRRDKDTIDSTEAIKRRAARIKAQLREDVYCSSDDDIVSSLRQKFDDLISLRAQRMSETSTNDTRFHSEEDDGEILNYSQRSRPRKLTRRELPAEDEGDKSPIWVDNRDYPPRKKHHGLSVAGDSQKEYKSPSYYRQTEVQHHNHRGERDREGRYFYEPKSDIRTYASNSHRTQGQYHQQMTSPTKLQGSRIYHEKHGQQRGQMFTPPGNKPLYHSAHQGILLDRKIGHTHHHHSMALSNRSTAAPKRVEEQKAPRRRMQHLA